MKLNEIKDNYFKDLLAKAFSKSPIADDEHIAYDDVFAFVKKELKCDNVEDIRFVFSNYHHEQDFSDLDDGGIINTSNEFKLLHVFLKKSRVKFQTVYDNEAGLGVIIKLGKINDITICKVDRGLGSFYAVCWKELE